MGVIMYDWIHSKEVLPKLLDDNAVMKAKLEEACLRIPELPITQLHYIAI